MPKALHDELPEIADGQVTRVCEKTTERRSHASVRILPVQHIPTFSRQIEKRSTTSGEDSAHLGAPSALNVAVQFFGHTSASKHVWCIEDACNRCLTHVEGIQGDPRSSAMDAIWKAKRMIRDGSMPTPEEAIANRDRIERAKRGIEEKSNALQRRQVI